MTATTEDAERCMAMFEDSGANKMRSHVSYADVVRKTGTRREFGSTVAQVLAGVMMGCKFSEIGHDYTRMEYYNGRLL